MPEDSEEVKHDAVEDPTSKEKSCSSLSCEDNVAAANDHDVEESSSVHNIKNEKNVGEFLSIHLDKKGFCEGFAYIWGQWTNIGLIYVWGQWTDIEVDYLVCIFKLFLWCLRLVI